MTFLLDLYTVLKRQRAAPSDHLYVQKAVHYKENDIAGRGSMLTSLLSWQYQRYCLQIKLQNEPAK